MTPVYHLKLNAVGFFLRFFFFQYVPNRVKFKLSSYSMKLHDNSDNLQKIRYHRGCLPHDADNSRVSCQNAKPHNSYDVLLALAVPARLLLFDFTCVFQ